MSSLGFRLLFLFVCWLLNLATQVLSIEAHHEAFSA